MLRFDAVGSTSVARKFNFTRDRINTLPLPTNGQRSYFYDTKVRGLAIAITPAGKKSFVLYRKIARRPERIQIGPYADLSIEQARHRAEELNAQIALGKNPGHERRNVREEMTLGELFETYLQDHARRLARKTWREDVRRFNLHFHSWRLRKISSIKQLEVVRLHTHISRASGPIAANRAVEMLRRVFNKGLQWGWKGENPAEAVERNPERSRARFLDGDELPAFFRAVADEPNETIRDYIFLSLLTGARRSNVQQMRWAEIDWQRALWKIAETKNNEPLVVPLMPAAMRILDARKANNSQWVFPGTGRTGHLVSPKGAWKRILKRAAITDLRLHDLRRTLGSWQATMGSSLPIIGKSLGHKSLAATQIYARLNLDPVRASIGRATDAMLLAGGDVVGLVTEGKKV
ncbi:MAG TPA: tyrosine-type recombinase/integrase [Terriglobales bacterium]|nr:tyrosine-type recombinase/integrase [Terriglobales bacterium]